MLPPQKDCNVRGLVDLEPNWAQHAYGYCYNGCKAAQNVEVTCMRPTLLKNMLEKYLFVTQ